MEEKVITLTPKAAVALEFLQSQQEPITGAAIAEATGLNPKGVSGVLNSLFKNKLVDKGEKVTMDVVDKKGLVQQREYVTYFATPAGRDFVITE